VKLDKKKILVAVTGMSPQIITETLFALYRQKSWIPNEVWVLTTSIGKRQIVDNLLGKHDFSIVCARNMLCLPFVLMKILFRSLPINQMFLWQISVLLKRMIEPPIKSSGLFIIYAAMKKQNCMYRLQAVGNQWGFISAMRCLCLAEAKTVYRMFWWRKLSNSILSFIIRIKMTGF